MAQLTVRNLPSEVVRALKIRAAQHARSAEAEHRLILVRALRTAGADFWTRADALRRQSAGRQRHESARLLRQMRDQR
jgi:plasmid stability protein